MPTYKIAKGSNVYDVDPDEMAPDARSRFDSDVKAGKVLILNEPQKAPSPQMEGVFAPLKFKGKDSSGREGASFWTPEATNRARTAITGIPGAAMGGPAGLAAHFGSTALLPDSMMDQSNAESIQNGVSSVATGGISKLLSPALKAKPLLREGLSGALGALTGSVAGQVPSGQIDPKTVAADTALGGLAGAGFQGLLERARTNSAAAKSREFLGEFTGQDVNRAGDFTPTSGKATLAAETLAGQLPRKQTAISADIAKTQGTISKLDEMGKKLSPESQVRFAKPALSELPPEVRKISDAVIAAKSPGEKAYHTSRLQEFTREMKTGEERAAYEKVVPFKPGFTPENKTAFVKEAESAKKQLMEVDKTAAELSKTIGEINEQVRLNKASGGKSFAGAQDRLKLRDAEYANLVKQREQIISQRDETLLGLVKDDKARQSQLQNLGYVKQDFDNKLSQLRLETIGTTTPIAPGVKSAMEASKKGGSEGLIEYMKTANAPDADATIKWLKQAGGQDVPLRAAIINDFFSSARNLEQNNFSNIQQAIQQYPAEKMKVLFGDDDKATKFRKMADTMMDALTKQGEKNKTGNFLARTAGYSAAGALASAGSNLLLHDVVSVPLGGIGAAGGAVAISIARVIEKGMNSPSFYHAWQEYVENAGKGVRGKASAEVQKFVKEYGDMKTPAQVEQMKQEAYQAELQRYARMQQMNQNAGGGQPQPPTPGPSSPAGGSQPLPPNAPPAQTGGAGGIPPQPGQSAAPPVQQ